MPHIQKQSTGLTGKLFLLLGKMLQDHEARQSDQENALEKLQQKHQQKTRTPFYLEWNEACAKGVAYFVIAGHIGVGYVHPESYQRYINRPHGIFSGSPTTIAYGEKHEELRAKYGEKEVWNFEKGWQQEVVSIDNLEEAIKTGEGILIRLLSFVLVVLGVSESTVIARKQAVDRVGMFASPSHALEMTDRELSPPAGDDLQSQDNVLRIGS